MVSEITSEKEYPAFQKEKGKFIARKHTNVRQIETARKNNDNLKTYSDERRNDITDETRNKEKNTKSTHILGKAPLHKSDDLWKASLLVSGMVCAACAAAIKNKFKNEPWIKSFVVNPITNSATVEFLNEINQQKIVDAIEEAGFGVEILNVDRITTLPTETQSRQRNVRINVEGVVNDNYQSQILNKLRNLDGILEIEHTARDEELILNVTYTPDPPSLTIRDIINTIATVDPCFKTSIYHPPTLEERSRKIQAREQFRILIRALITLAIAIPTMIIGFIYMSLVSKYNQVHIFFMEPVKAGISRAQWALFILATPVYFFCADVFHECTVTEITSLWHSKSSVPILQRFYRFGSMNMLISTGTSIAYISSIAQLISAGIHPPIMTDNNLFYFDSVVFLTLFQLVGRLIEIFSKAKTGNAVLMLANLRPVKAHLVEPESAENQKNIEVDLLEYGDLVEVFSGESPPCDGIIVYGETSFDESSLTGESKAVRKTVGDEVFSGTVNNNSSIIMRITSIAGDSMLEKIISAVQDGQTKEAAIQRIADQLTNVFVPLIFLIAIITWGIWLEIVMSNKLPTELLNLSLGSRVSWSLQFAIAVVVIACPCGLALAAPTALYVGSGIAAENGILAKGGGEALEKTAKLKCVVFDKTGTVTNGGEPQVTNHRYIAYNREEGELYLAMTKEIERHSNHTIAKAVVSFCNGYELEQLRISDIKEIPGKGMKGIVHRRFSACQEVIVGNEALLSDYRVQISESARSLIDSWKSEGKSIALTATKTWVEEDISIPIQGNSLWKLVAFFAITDHIRPEALGVIKVLKERGIGVWMLSGDNKITADRVGSQIGIPTENIIADVLPEQKAERIEILRRTLINPDRPLRRQNCTLIAMVGDGINDYPALTAADVSIAIGSGSDIAITSADIVLVNSDLRSLIILLDLSKYIFFRIKINFGWALVYNLFALPVAAGALYPITRNGTHLRLDPVWASLAMATSSISVICSSLLMRSRVPGLGYRPSQISDRRLNRSIIEV
ncbi:Copper-transporting ATPase HMA5 [Erysiphe neolycopersici]|uniref:Copper-transporting ATPase HMA5 n=1 Tax=Erysiphe neolycopersici TaxID=212602 RepID=A0A420HRA5_9PEZI|nr:Copper-transporting ATPase HMA5 [Erysiphe neolycopersici]